MYFYFKQYVTDKQVRNSRDCQELKNSIHYNNPSFNVQYKKISPLNSVTTYKVCWYFIRDHEIRQKVFVRASADILLNAFCLPQWG